jgi:hypothetical protein
METTAKIMFLLCFWVNHLHAQQVNYEVTQDAPNFESIPNLFVTPFPLTSMDFPFVGPNPDALDNASVFGFGLAAHAILGNRIQADLKLHQGIWPGKSTQFELGGALITKTKIKNKTIPVVLSRKELSRQKVSFENKSRVTEQVTYIDVPATQQKFSGFRGGLMYYNTQFNFTEGSFSRELMAIPRTEGNTNSVGIYAGFTWGTIRNLHIKLKNGGNFKHASYFRWYFDVLLAAHSHTYIVNNTSRTPLPFGARIGREFNLPFKGAFGTVTQMELGYRPGYDGLYLKMGISFIQVRREVQALRTLLVNN